MNAESRQAHQEQSAAVQRRRWAELSEFDGSVSVFWEHYLQAIGQDLQARGVLLLSASVGQPWKALAQWPAQAHLWSGDPAELLQMLAGLVDEQPQLEHLPQGGQLLAMRLPQPAAAQVLAVVALVCWLGPARRRRFRRCGPAMRAHAPARRRVRRKAAPRQTRQ